MLVVFGLDGATLDLAGAWMDDGTLPTLARLRARGQWGTLRSTVPAATMPSWTTFMTGVNPGGHGVFDFTRRMPGTYDVSFVNSTFRKVPTIWRLLSDAGKRVAVLGMPGTYPPEPVNGVMVSGFDAPVTTRANRSFIYPPALADEVMRLGGFSFADFQEFYVDPGWYRTAASRLLQSVEAKARLAGTLMMRDAWDCFALVFGESDTVAHHFWHFHDSHSPRFDAAGAAELGSAIHSVYRAIDAAIGALLERLPADVDVLVASDHGFGGAGAKAVYVNRWLEAEGWLSFARQARGDIASGAKRAALRLLPARWQAPLFRSFNGRLANRLESQARFAGIDWRRTRAFSEELNYFPSIWINRADRDPLGQVADADYERVCAEIAAGLRAWRDAESGAPVVQRVWHRGEVYRGPWVDLAPDLIVELAEDHGYSYCALPSRGEAGAPLRRLGPAELVGGKRFGMSGSHRANGMFVLTAGAADSSGQQAADIADMAPTILRLCGVGVPDWMEGRALVDGEATARAGESPALDAERFYTAHDERMLEERLRALGYLG